MDGELVVQESMFLTQNEIKELTNRLARSAQSRALNSLGIEHKFRPDGSIVVLRAHAVQTLGGGATLTARPKKTEPNWNCLR